MKRTLAALLLASCLPPGSVQAGGTLRLANSEITLGGDTAAAKLTAENIGDTPLYIDVIQQQIQMPVTSPEVRVPVGEVVSPSLLVSPPRLVLAPGQKRELNVSVLCEPQSRQIWRITFQPREQFNVLTSDNALIQAPLSVSIGYGVVIYHLGKKRTNRERKCHS